MLKVKGSIPGHGTKELVESLCLEETFFVNTKVEDFSKEDKFQHFIMKVVGLIVGHK